VHYGFSREHLWGYPDMTPPVSDNVGDGNEDSANSRVPSTGARLPKARVEEVFHSALEQPPEDRVSFIEKAAEGDAELQEHVRRLLAAYQRSDELFEEPLSPDIQRELARLKPEEEGERIDRYKLLQEIGQGGFGTVWMAEQLEPVSRRVALKIIKMGMDTREVIGRFEQERQALAMMDHPNIAKVFDAGATPFGRPYFVMELVRGVPITDFADERQLDTRQRLELFADVCAAINHAHQKGVIHRDIKPSNVLVTLHGDKAVVKVIDFGIAKATQGKLTDKTLFTRFEQFIGTPAYMSPEQATMSGLDIDTRSDIYALGVLLYELLTGKPPFDAKSLASAGYEEMRRIIREVDPPRPSMRLSTARGEERTVLARARHIEPAKLCNTVEPDLDWIVMKAIEKDRARRYETANGLALDISRFLLNEPVGARPPSAGYRLGKAIRRNRLAFAAGTVVLSSMVVGLGVATVGLMAARHERDAALVAKSGEALQRRAAQEAQRVTRQRAYAAEMNGAFEALFTNNLGRARDLLGRQRPRAGEEDLRGFEWRHLWQLCRSDEIASFNDGTSGGLAFSGDGRLLAHGGSTVIVRDVASRSIVAKLETSAVTVAFSPTTNLLASGGDNEVALWNTLTWQRVRTLPGTRHPVLFSPDGQSLVTGEDGGIRVWNTDTWEKVGFCPGEPIAQVWSTLLGAVAFSPDGKLLFTPGHRRGVKGGQFQLWDFPALTPIESLSHSKPVLWSSAFLTDGKRFLTGQYSGALCVWDLSQGRIVETLTREHSGGISGIVVSKNGKTFVTASADHSLIIWDSFDIRPLTRLRGHLDQVGSLALSPDGLLLASSAADGTVNLWDTSRRVEERYLRNSKYIVGVSSDSKALLAVPDERIGLVEPERSSILRWELSRDNAVKRIDSTAKRKTHVADLPEMKWKSWLSKPFAFHPDGTHFAIARSDGRIEVWNALDGLRVDEWTSPGQALSAATFSPDGKSLATGTIDGAVIVWEMDSHREIVRFDGTGDAVHHLTFAPDGKLLVCAGSSAIRVWDLGRKGPATIISQPGEEVIWAAISPNSQSLASCSLGESDVTLWELPSGKMRTRLRGHAQMVDNADFAPDGRTLATCGRDMRVKLWNVDTHQEIATLRFDGSCRTVRFSPDGRNLAVGYYHVTDGYRNNDGAHIRLLQAPSWEEIAKMELADSTTLRQR
jgi:WD40 repeat protein